VYEKVYRAALWYGSHYLSLSKVGMCIYTPHGCEGKKDGPGKRPTEIRIQSLQFIFPRHDYIHPWHVLVFHSTAWTCGIIPNTVGARIRPSHHEIAWTISHGSPQFIGSPNLQGGSFMCRLGSQLNTETLGITSNQCFFYSQNIARWRFFFKNANFRQKTHCPKFFISLSFHPI
jgi:hypothetical protein